MLPHYTIMVFVAMVAVLALVIYLVRDASCPKCGHHVIQHRKETLPDGISVRHTYTCAHCHHEWTRG
jgi:DNA-directed RNA polymerase subunit RPC12/RpoP